MEVQCCWYTYLSGNMSQLENGVSKNGSSSLGPSSTSKLSMTHYSTLHGATLATANGDCYIKTILFHVYVTSSLCLLIFSMSIILAQMALPSGWPAGKRATTPPLMEWTIRVDKYNKPAIGWALIGTSVLQYNMSVCFSKDLLLMPHLLPLHNIEHDAEEFCNF